MTVVVCVLTVLAVVVGEAAIARAMRQRAQHTLVPTQGVPAVVPAASPAPGPIDTYSGPITHGASQNDLYVWLAGRAGKIVHLVISMRTPVAVDLIHRPRHVDMKSNCTAPGPPANCDSVLGSAGVHYLIYGDGTGLITNVKGTVNVDAYFAVDPVTLDQKGYYTLPLRMVSQGGPAGSEGDG
jgi:hypothetical protein